MSFTVSHYSATRSVPAWFLRSKFSDGFCSNSFMDMVSEMYGYGFRDVFGILPTFAMDIRQDLQLWIP